MIDSTVSAEPMPFRVLLDEAMKLTRRFFRVIYPSVAIPLAVIAVLLMVVQIRFLTGWMGRGMAAPQGMTPENAMFGGCAAYMVTILASLAVHGLTYAVLTSACVDGAAGRPISMGAKWSFVFEPSTLWTLVLAFFAVAAGLMCLILPGLYIGLMLSFVIPVMAAENLRGGAALGRSWRLIRYNPHKRFLANTGTKIFLLYLVGALIAYAVSFIVQLPFTAMQGYRMVRTISAGGGADPSVVFGRMLWWQLPSAILSSLVSTAVGVYTSFGLVLLYLDVVRRKEGVDLAAAIDAHFPGAPPPAAPGAPA
jgi:hypothetical protein